MTWDDKHEDIFRLRALLRAMEEHGTVRIRLVAYNKHTGEDVYKADEVPVLFHETLLYDVEAACRALELVVGITDLMEDGGFGAVRIEAIKETKS